MANTTNFNWETPDDTDLVKDGAAAIRTLGSAIDTSLVDLKGGTTGQILSKATNTDMDFTWITNDVGDITEVTAGTGISGGGTSGAVTITNSMATEIAAKGDLIVGTGSATFDNLTVGANNTVLTADSSTATGLKWATPAGGGKVLQVIQDTLTTILSVTSTTYADTGLEVTITPSSASSKILVMAHIQGAGKLVGNASTRLDLQLLRGATTIMVQDRNAFTNSSQTNNIGTVAYTILDSPATTSATTYKVQIRSGVSGQTVRINDYETTENSTSTIIVMEIGA